MNCAGGSLAMPRCQNRTDIPRPHRHCGISTRDSLGTSPEQVLCAITENISTTLRVPTLCFSSSWGGGLGIFLFLMFCCGCSKSSIPTKAKTRGFVLNNALIRVFPIITSWCQFSHSTHSFPFVCLYSFMREITLCLQFPCFSFLFPLQ